MARNGSEWLGMARNGKSTWNPMESNHSAWTCVKVVLNGVMSELLFKYDGVSMELQGSRLGFNVCVAPSSVKLGVLEFAEVRVRLELDWS